MLTKGVSSVKVHQSNEQYTLVARSSGCVRPNECRKASSGSNDYSGCNSCFGTLYKRD